MVPRFFIELTYVIHDMTQNEYTFYEYRPPVTSDLIHFYFCKRPIRRLFTPKKQQQLQRQVDSKTMNDLADSERVN